MLTRGEEYAQLTECLRKAQEHAANLSHLAGMNNLRDEADGWLRISEMYKQNILLVTAMATGRRQ